MNAIANCVNQTISKLGGQVKMNGFVVSYYFQILSSHKMEHLYPHLLLPS